MLCESIHASPRCNYQAVKELLTPPRPSQPRLSHQQQNRKYNSIPDERAPHDEMRQTLPKMVAATEAHCRDAAK